jgi:hypothetical protein
LRQIDPAIQERPQRKLAGLGQPRSRRACSLYAKSQDYRRTMARDLHEIFSCIRARRAKVVDHHLVDDRAGLIH